MSVLPRVVFDTQLWVRGTSARPSLARRVTLDMSAYYVPLFSWDTYRELERVYDYPEVRRKMRLTDVDVSKALSAIRLRAEFVPVTEVPAVSRDPKDDIFLACAVAGRADYLVSADNDLLVLNPYQGIQIVELPTFFNVLQNQG